MLIVSLVGLITHDQLQTAPCFAMNAMNVGYSVVEVIVHLQGSNAKESRVLLVDHSLAGWIAP